MQKEFIALGFKLQPDTANRYSETRVFDSNWDLYYGAYLSERYPNVLLTVTHNQLWAQMGYPEQHPRILLGERIRFTLSLIKP